MTVRGAFLSALLAILGGALLIGLPASQRAPADQGLCWTLTSGQAAEAAFAPLDRNIGNPETCAARLEAVRLMRGGPVSGAYQGFYLFADDDGLSVAASLDGPRRELMSPKDRDRIDRAIGDLIRDRATREGITVEPAPQAPATT
jgi:hypothetical protein